MIATLVLLISTAAPAALASQPVTTSLSIPNGAIKTELPHRPDFDSEVLAPLKIAQTNYQQQIKAQQEQAEAAQKAAEAQAAQVTVTPAPVAQSAPVASSDTLGSGWAALRNCESGGNYATNTGNGYYGAYQYDIGTWGDYGGYHLPSDAPPSIQDAKALATYAARGSSPWPVCGRFL